MVFNNNHLVVDPDSHVYTLMIHSCAKTQEPEKALDLFQEVADRNVPVTPAMFNGRQRLIR